jgi:condensin complex subunit 1
MYTDGFITKAAQTTIMQNLQYWEHSAEPMAELLVYMVDKQNYTQLADEILREISNREFKDTTSKELKDSPNPKTFATFLLTLAELSKKTILKNLTVLINLLDSDVRILHIKSLTKTNDFKNVVLYDESCSY